MRKQWQLEIVAVLMIQRYNRRRVTMCCLRILKVIDGYTMGTCGPLPKESEQRLQHGIK